MANRLREVESEKAQSQAVESTTVRAPVQQTAEERTVVHRSLPAVVVPFFLVIAIAIAGAMYLHDKRVKQQKALYKEYLALNAWKPPMEAEYAKFAPALDDIERIDPATQNDFSKYSADIDLLNSESGKLVSLLDKSSRASTLLYSKGSIMLDAYRDVYALSLEEQKLRNNEASSYEGRDFIAWRMTDLWRMQQSKAVTDRALNLKHVYLFRGTYRMDNAQMANYLDVQLPQLWTSAKRIRANFENALKTQADVPEGLDVEYARKLK